MKETKIKKNLQFVLLYILLLAANPWLMVLIREWSNIGKINFSFTANGLTSSLSRYFYSFSGNFLFFNGDWFSLGKAMGSQGVLYLADALLLAFGLVFLIRAKRDFWDNLMLCLLFLAPLPSVIFPQNALTITSSLMIFPLIFIIASGVSAMLKRDKRWLIPLTPFYLISFLRFYDLYFLHP